MISKYVDSENSLDQIKPWGDSLNEDFNYHHEKNKTKTTTAKSSPAMTPKIYKQINPKHVNNYLNNDFDTKNATKKGSKILFEEKNLSIPNKYSVFQNKPGVIQSELDQIYKRLLYLQQSIQFGSKNGRISNSKLNPFLNWKDAKMNLQRFSKKKSINSCDYFQNLTKKMCLTVKGKP